LLDCEDSGDILGVGYTGLIDGVFKVDVYDSFLFFIPGGGGKVLS